MLFRNLQNYFLPKGWQHIDPARAKIEWLIRLRWIAVFAQSLCVVPALYLGYLEPKFFFKYTGTVALLVVFNVVSSLIYRKKKTVSETDLLCQLVADITALTILLMLTGGAWNPLLALIFLHAGFGALLLTKIRGYVFFLCLTLCLIALQWVPDLPSALHNGLTPPLILFSSYLLVAFVTWRLTAWLSRTLVSLQEYVGQLQDRELRMDRLRAVGALASGFSHEFATPLGTIKMRLERAARRSPAGTDPDIQVALEAVDQCEIALKSLNDNRVQAEHLSLTPVSLRKTVERVVETWQKDRPNIHIEITNALCHDDTLLLPQVAFSQIVLNLLDNAVEAGAENPAIKIEFLEKGDYLCLQLTDNGIGFSDVVFRQWGEPFVTTKSDGTGLGIFNAISLAQALGGSFQGKNIKGGACVKFCLPRPEVSYGK
ncbi:MAG: HAMP domain-containing sensor histidine kinase [Oligoflexia bacterium]|nr:HAMP domain-containing sensor histidine kinase [Oligoflexia bacterium]